MRLIYSLSLVLVAGSLLLISHSLNSPLNVISKIIGGFILGFLAWYASDLAD